MFTRSKEYLASAPGFIHVPIEFSPDRLNDFLKENLELHRVKSAKFLQQYKEFEEIEKEVWAILSIDGVERVADNNFIEMNDHLLAVKHLKKFLKNNPDLLLPFVRITSLNKRILLGNDYRVHSDFMLEIPSKFKDDVLEQFIKDAQHELMLAV